MKINNSKNTKLKLIYTDAKNNKWYGLINPIADLSAVRGIAGGRAERYVGMMISESEFDLAIEEQSKAFKEMDIAKAAAITYDLKYRRKFIVEEKSVLDLAGIYFFLEDEDPEQWSEHHMLKKQAIWQDDKACRDFFLRMGFALTKKFQNMSEDDLLKFMEESRTVAERLYRHIQTPIQRLNNTKTT